MEVSAGGLTEAAPTSSSAMQLAPQAFTQVTRIDSNTRIEPITATPSPTATQLHDKSEVRDRSLYDLKVLLDYTNHRLTVSQTLEYVNQTMEPISEILLIVDPNRYSGSFSLLELRNGIGEEIAGYRLTDTRLRIPLHSALEPRSSVILSMVYTLNLPDQPGKFGYTQRQTNLGDWYPYVPPYQPGAGWLTHRQTVVGENLVYDKVDIQVEISFVDDSTDLTIAASAPALGNNKKNSFQLNNARNFAWSVSSSYRVLTRTVNSTTLSAYILSERNTAGNAALEAMASAFSLYSQLFGPYPNSSLTLVEAEFHDGMEYEGLYFFNQTLLDNYMGQPNGYLTAIAAHETAHQWWYGVVGNDQAIEPWLDEAMATYSELLFYETFYPELAEWWWDFRVLRFEPSGCVNSTIYEHEDFRSYVDAVYLRGALFLQDIRGFMGDELFFSVLKDYFANNADRIATRSDFFSSLPMDQSGDLADITAKYCFK